MEPQGIHKENQMKKEIEWKMFDKAREMLLKHNAFLLWMGSDQAKSLPLIKDLKKDGHLFIQEVEAYNIYSAAKNVRKIPGCFAEVGVYKGGSARVICEADKRRKVYLFDTFQGLPKPIKSKDEQGFEEGQLVGTIDEVKMYLAGYNCEYKVGIFPETAKGLEDKRFAFVNLDVDLYKSTLDCLNWFWYRMNPGGIIISHDYQNLKGVRKAFDEFFKDKVAPIIELPGCQCMVVRV
jgi:O-methyltransferase